MTTPQRINASDERRRSERRGLNEEEHTDNNEQPSSPPPPPPMVTPPSYCDHPQERQSRRRSGSPSIMKVPQCSQDSHSVFPMEKCSRFNTLGAVHIDKPRHPGIIFQRILDYNKPWIGVEPFQITNPLSRIDGAFQLNKPQRGRGRSVSSICQQMPATPPSQTNNTFLMQEADSVSDRQGERTITLNQERSSTELPLPNFDMEVDSLMEANMLDETDGYHREQGADSNIYVEYNYQRPLQRSSYRLAKPHMLGCQQGDRLPGAYLFERTETNDEEGYPSTMHLSEVSDFDSEYDEEQLEEEEWGLADYTRITSKKWGQKVLSYMLTFLLVWFVLAMVIVMAIVVGLFKANARRTQQQPESDILFDFEDDDILGGEENEAETRFIVEKEYLVSCWGSKFRWGKDFFDVYFDNITEIFLANIDTNPLWLELNLSGETGHSFGACYHEIVPFYWLAMDQFRQLVEQSGDNSTLSHYEEFSQNLTSDIHIRNRFGLTAMYVDFSGHLRSWNWLSHEDECTWSGVECDELGRVVGVYRDNLACPNEILVSTISGCNHLADGVSLHPNTFALKWLETLSLKNSDVVASIPKEISHLTSLKRLDLSWNAITGTIPTEISYLYNLEKLDLRGNFLSGTVPSDFIRLHSVEFIDISSNILGGNISGDMCETFRTIDFFVDCDLCSPGCCENCQ